MYNKIKCIEILATTFYAIGTINPIISPFWVIWDINTINNPYYLHLMHPKSNKMAQLPYRNFILQMVVMLGTKYFFLHQTECTFKYPQWHLKFSLLSKSKCIWSKLKCAWDIVSILNLKNACISIVIVLICV